MKTIIKRQRRTIGAIVKVPLEKGFHTYARILKYDFAFYDFRTDHFVLVENGVRRPATKEECKGLERSAVWTPEGIQRRLNDHYAGRKNYYIEKDENLEGNISSPVKKIKVA